MILAGLKWKVSQDQATCVFWTVRAEDAPSAPLQGEDKYPRMLMVLGLMEK